MKAGVLFFIIRDIANYLEANGMLKTDGTVILTDTAKDIAIASVVETSLKEHGVNTPDQVDRVIKALPLVLGLFIK